MPNKRRILIAGFATLGCALTFTSFSRTLKPTLDLKSLPTIKADEAHQINVQSQKNLSYEVPAGKGFVVETSDYKKEYAQAGSITVDAEVLKRISLNPIPPTQKGSVSVDLVPGQHRYALCPDGGLHSGDNFTVRIAEEVTDWGHYNFYPRWSAYVNVK